MTEKDHIMSPHRPGIVTIETNRLTHYARYIVENKTITVSSIYGSKTTQLGQTSPPALAVSILEEMIEQNFDLLGKEAQCKL
ncbi:MAG: hypothetical protein ABJA83_16195, partial [Burkholderiaceae bacterium]